MSNGSTKLQDDPNVLAYQFLNEHETDSGTTIRFGGNAFLKDGLTWDQVFEGLRDRTVSQFVNCKTIIWKTRPNGESGKTEGFKRF